jgi:hypothetical protein
MQAAPPGSVPGALTALIEGFILQTMIRAGRAAQKLVGDTIEAVVTEIRPTSRVAVLP